jgi:hypothetical protein
MQNSVTQHRDLSLTTVLPPNCPAVFLALTGRIPRYYFGQSNTVSLQIVYLLDSHSNFSVTLDRTMAQVVSVRPLAAEAQILAQVIPCEFCSGQSDTETGFSPSPVFSCQYHFTVALHAYISSEG